MRHIPKAYERYRHFKGNCYQILAIAKDSEDASEQVVYQALYPPFDIYVRPLTMFMSEVDHEKYPSAAQHYRFELVSGEESLPESSAALKTESPKAAAMQSGYEQAGGLDAEGSNTGGTDAEGEIDENVMAFLDADTYEQKLKIFSAIHDRVTQDMLNTIAVSLDIEVEPGDLEERYRQIQNCLMTFQKYECNRLR